jgi:hypothetical protein
MSGTDTTQRERVRLYATGSCEGFDKLRDSLASHPEIELVGSSTTSQRRGASPAGTSRPSCTHAQRDFPADEINSIRSTPGADPAGRSSGSAGLLEQALDADVSDVLLLPQLVENVVFAIRKSTHSGRRHADSNGGGRRTARS